MCTPSSLIITLHPYYPPPTELLHSTPPCLPLALILLLPLPHLLSTLFGLAKWDQFFVIPPTAHSPYSENALLFQQCLQKQVGEVTYRNRSDCSCLVIVIYEFQACALLS